MNIFYPPLKKMNCFNFFKLKKIKLRKIFLNFYKSKFGRLFYSTNFCKLDWISIIFIFAATYFFTSLAGQKAMMNGYIGNWYADRAALISISIYNTGKIEVPIVQPGSALDDFITLGCRGELRSYNITNEKIKNLRHRNIGNFYKKTFGIPLLIAYWWKLIGNPDWSTLYILFSIIYGFTSVAAYCALRQVTGTLPAFFLTLILSFHPLMMNLIIFSIRDGIRALFCFIAIAILIYQFEEIIVWKGFAICSLFLFFICSISSLFRNDFIILIPFIIIIIFFHGKIFSNLSKKIFIILSIIFGLLFSSFIKKDIPPYSFGHVLYIGLAEYPYMNLLKFSSQNYSKGIAYADSYGMVVAAGKAFREKSIFNLQFYSKEYDQFIKEELYSLFKIYPYDFLRLGLSASMQSLFLGSKHANRSFKYIENAPGYWLYSKMSKNIFSCFSISFYIITYLVLFLLFLGGKFYKNLFFCIAIMANTSCYLYQFDIRHNFYLIIISLLAFGFIFNRFFRIFFLVIYDLNKMYSICKSKIKILLQHLIIFILFILICSTTLLYSYWFQKKQLKKEILTLNELCTQKIDFQTRQPPSIIAPQKYGTVILFPDFYKCILIQNSRQNYFSEFIKVRFKILDKDTKIVVCSKYENTASFRIFNNHLLSKINTTKTYPIPLTFNANSGLNTLYFPIYFSRDSSPLIGLEFFSDGKKIEVESVERVIDTEKISTQSAFLIPNSPNNMQYAGIISWNDIISCK